MTENEAIYDLKMIKHTRVFVPSEEVWEMAIQSLEEIQQYRAIGLTPELIEAMQGHNIAMINDLGEYQAIGTVAEFKAFKTENAQLHCEIQAIGATMDALENEIRNKAIEVFAKRLTDKIVSKYCSADLTSQYVGMQTCEWIKEIANQMKEGAE